MGSNPARTYKKSRPHIGSGFFGAGNRTRFAFCPIGTKLGCHLRRAEGEQQSTGLLHSDGFESAPNIKQKREAKASLFYLVPATGLEPVRFLRRGILSPLCLPISPCRQGDNQDILAHFYSAVKSRIISSSISGSSAGSVQKRFPPTASISSRSRNPQRTLRQGTPAFLAVCTSTSLSPT